MYTLGIIIASDKGSAGQREDKSGPAIMELMERRGFETRAYRMVPDDQRTLEETMIDMADHLGLDLIVTSGGTGFSRRDVTPEATKAVGEREAPGISEAIRMYSLEVTRRAMLSRGVSVIRGKTLIINLPGSPKGAVESLSYILDSLPHGLDILKGEASECART